MKFGSEIQGIAVLQNAWTQGCENFAVSIVNRLCRACLKVSFHTGLKDLACSLQRLLVIASPQQCLRIPGLCLDPALCRSFQCVQTVETEPDATHPK